MKRAICKKCKLLVPTGRWATQRLREYLVKGYTINQQRFEQNAEELKQALALIQKTARSPGLATDMGRGLVEIMGRYTRTFLWLQQYDEGLLKEPGGNPGGVLPTPEAAMASILELKIQLTATNAAGLFCSWIFFTVTAA